MIKMNYVGMPAMMWLDAFGSQVWSVFGQPPFLVGSALTEKDHRDVDVRLILADEEWSAHDLGDPARPGENAKWVGLCMAFSELGRKMTGLPIDFQIQQMTNANKNFRASRMALGILPFRKKTA